MQLKSVLLAACLLAFGAGAAAAQSLSPMRAEGATPSDIKGFRLTVGNPYKTRMTFVVVPMDPKFEVEIAEASVSAPELRLAPGASRPVVVQFRIDPALKGNYVFHKPVPVS